MTRPSWRDRCRRCRFSYLRCMAARGCCIDCDHRPPEPERVCPIHHVVLSVCGGRYEAWPEDTKPLTHPAQTAYRDGVLQPGWKLDPACDHDYAPCPFCPPLKEAS